MPSLTLSIALDLRGVPQSFNQVLADGSPGALSFSAPATFDGNLLYVREDLLKRYAKGRSLVWYFWGERQIYPYPLDKSPDWLVQAMRTNADEWLLVKRGEELAPAFRTNSKKAVPSTANRRKES